MESWIVSLFIPLITIFLAISTPNEPSPLKNRLHFDYLATASIPIAPIYLLHLSFTFSSLISMNPLSFWKSTPSLVSSSLYPTSISSIFATPWVISKWTVPFFVTFFLDDFYPFIFNFVSAALGAGIEFKASSSSLTASLSIYGYFDLNSEHQWLLWSLTNPT